MTNHIKQLSNPSSTGDVGVNFETEIGKNKVKNRFGIIQLSDLQFGKNHIFKNAAEFSKNLLSDIKEMSGECDFIPRYIVLSGDITEEADAKEFNDAANVIEGVLVDLNIDRKLILCVPGNHDVNKGLCERSKGSGSDQLKFQPYNDFVAKITHGNQGTARVDYPLIRDKVSGKVSDEDHIIEFLLLNSCEKIDPHTTYAYICKEKLQKTLKSKKEKESLRIVVAHHPLQPSVGGELKAIMRAAEKADNMSITNMLQERSEASDRIVDIKEILHYHKCDIVLTGHTHQAKIDASLSPDGHLMIFAGCGSTGIEQRQRGEGIRNQYSIHVIDFGNNKFQSIHRAFNPTIRNDIGKGCWQKDDTIQPNPSKYDLPSKKLSKPKLIDPNKVDWNNDEFAEELAIAVLLGGWNEKD